jgi:hypothetical protein
MNSLKLAAFVKKRKKKKKKGKMEEWEIQNGGE